MNAEADAAAGAAAVDKEKKLTRRERRQMLNAKHASPQFPKIQNAQQRAKAYVRAAGLIQTPGIAQLPLEQTRFGRQLGAPDERLRHRTVLQLRQYLQARAVSEKGLTELDLLKLWKCLWFTLYMADRVPVQQELSQHLCSLVWSLAGTLEEDEYAARTYLEMCGDNEDEEIDNDTMEDDDDDDDVVTMEELENTLDVNGRDGPEEKDEAEESDEDEDDESIDEDISPSEVHENNEEDNQNDNANLGHCRGAHLVSLFFRTCFRTVLREWAQMDKYRIDKFYTLLRDMMNVMYQYMAQRTWNYGITRLFNDAMFDEVLSKTPNGVRYHLIDVCIEELAKVAAMDESPPLTEALFVEILEPFCAMAQGCGGGDDTIHNRVVENVFEKFLFRYSVLHEKKDEERVPVFEQVHVGTVAQFLFEVASDSSIENETYRQNLYELYKKFMRRIEQVGEEHDVDIEGNESNELGVDSEFVGDAVHVNHHEDNLNDESVVSGDLPHKDAMNTTTLTIESKPVYESTAKKSRKKKKKRSDHKHVVLTKSENGDSAPKSIDIFNEEEITISLSEQKEARDSLKAHSIELQDPTEPGAGQNKGQVQTELGSIEQKRVKFDSTNTARSWKASMKGLRTMQSPVTKAKPKYSILLKKPARKTQQNEIKRKSSRKKATAN